MLLPSCTPQSLPPRLRECQQRKESDYRLASNAEIKIKIVEKLRKKKREAGTVNRTPIYRDTICCLAIRPFRQVQAEAGNRTPVYMVKACYPNHWTTTAGQRRDALLTTTTLTAFQSKHKIARRSFIPRVTPVNTLGEIKTHTQCCFLYFAVAIHFAVKN